MRRVSALMIALSLVSAACSSNSTDDASARTATTAAVTSTAAVGATTTSTDGTNSGSGATTLVSASDGGVVTFGDNVTLTVPAGALDVDTEIGISALAEPEWPAELSGLPELSVAGEYLQLSPDGLVFNEPAILSRRINEVVQISEGEVAVSSSAVLSRSDGTWEALQQTVVIDDDGAAVESPIEHFSDNVVIVGHEQILVRIELNPAKVQRLVGHHFLASLSVDPKLGTISTDFWRTFFTVDSGPLVLGIPSDYKVDSTSPESADKPAAPSERGIQEMIAPFSTPMPLKFPAAYNCAAVGQAVFGATFEMSVHPVEEIMAAISDLFRMGDDDEDREPVVPVGIKGTIKGAADCVGSPEDLTPGLVDVTSGVASDPANHSCCVKPPPRRARMTLGSLWFTDAKLGSSTDWQGLFFDPQAGSAGDVMNGVNDSTTNPPNTIEIELGDDFDQTGRFSASGLGTVAGLPGIRVTLEAVASDRGTWSGTLTKGVDGGLPTGQPIIYDISGSLIAPQPVAFVEELAQAFRDGDSEFLLDHLHPDVVGLYAGSCVDFADGISAPDLDIAVHSIVDVAEWTVTLDGHELTIPNAVSLDVTRTELGVANRAVMHIAARPGDGPPAEMAWFADCGDPFPAG